MKTPSIFTHKKFQAGIATTLSLLLAQLGSALAASSTFWAAIGSITPQEWLLIIGPVMIAIGAQGFADSGKEAAKIKEQSKSPHIFPVLEED